MRILIELAIDREIKYYKYALYQCRIIGSQKNVYITVGSVCFKENTFGGKYFTFPGF